MGKQKQGKGAKKLKTPKPTKQELSALMKFIEKEKRRVAQNDDTRQKILK
jgi:hypothetical protein